MSYEIIPAGDYAIRSEGDDVLVAHLGTCVGIGIHDPTTGVGGLVHLLLADPNGPVPSSQTFSYASTGLPLFLDLLRQSGANPKSLEAVVAGGALIGPVSDLDVNLDIGGRTADVAMEILREQGVRVLHSETGGLHGCRLEYHVNGGSWEITYFERESGDPNRMLPPKMTREDIGKAIQSVNPIPQTVLKVIRMIQEGDYQMRDIARNVRQDQILSAKVLTLCNSAFFARRSRISSIDTALVLLGERSFLQMILSASLESFFDEQHEGYSLIRGGLFYHSMGTGVVCEKLANTVGDIDPGIAYTAGLLHDIGKVVLDQFIARRWSIFYRAVKDPSVNLLDFESRLLGANHVQVGIQLAEDWALPDELREAIEFHHNPGKATINPRLVAIVSLADLLMSRFQVGLEIERLNTMDLQTVLDILGIKAEDFQTVVETIPWSDFGALLTFGSSSDADEIARPL